MTREIRIDMKKKARRVRGLLNLLTDDVYHVSSDADDFDLLCLEESINDTKETLQMIIDAVTELEYDLYLAKAHDSRN
jgi:hypothetical protein